MIVGLILLAGYVKGLPLFDLFLSGAKEGLQTSLKLLPTLIGLIVAVTMLRASGLLELLCGLLGPAAEAMGVSPQLLPLALLRPVSGSGASAYTLDLLKQFGPDSETGRIASVLTSSTETTFYAVAVYFGSLRLQAVAVYHPRSPVRGCNRPGGFHFCGKVPGVAASWWGREIPPRMLSILPKLGYNEKRAFRRWPL